MTVVVCPLVGSTKTKCLDLQATFNLPKLVSPQNPEKDHFDCQVTQLPPAFFPVVTLTLGEKSVETEAPLGGWPCE